MSDQQLIEFLEQFKQGDVYKRLEAIRKEFITSALEDLTNPVENEASVYRHVRVGGIVDGLRRNLVDELINELKNSKPIESE